MIEGNYFTDNEDLLLHFESIVPWGEVVEAFEGDFADARRYQASGDERFAMAPSNMAEALEFYRSILESAGEFAGKKIAPHVAELDREGVHFKDGKVEFPETMLQLVEEARQAGLQPTGLSRKYGGLGLPWSVRAFFTEMMYRVDAAMTIAIGCINLAEIIERNASDQMRERWIPALAAGEHACAMGLTEPDHGSDLPGLRTKARPATEEEKKKWADFAGDDSDSLYILDGAKRFITQGCGTGEKSALLLVLARTGAPESGARGLSFFLVDGANAQVAGIEKKLGMHASPTCEILFEGTPGLLVGQQGMGLVRYTMGMLNGARMGITQQSVGLATGAFEEAKKYASQRLQFGRLLQEIPAVSAILEDMESHIQAMRCLQFEGARAMDHYYWRGEHLTAKGATEKDIKSDTIIKYWEKLASILTPISKFYCSENCVRITGQAVQVHGGAGFTEDYDVARLYRDARITTIYDGTSQIQVNAAIGGIVTGMGKHGFLREYMDCEWDHFDSSETDLLDRMRSQFDKSVELYREMESDDRERFASDIVDGTARLLCSMLYYRSTLRVSPEKRERRLQLCRLYQLDSLAFLSGLEAKLSFAPSMVRAG
ncbi:MAG: acyl-CoA dehydrogenase family protein [Leptospiraceae bacterium]|nr:acyl-CoA dehydrogenase family protein [Leptospiraceae bacterium]